jgi:hypothetical protein
VVGEVQQRWHLWRRNYDLYIGGWMVYPGLCRPDSMHGLRCRAVERVQGAATCAPSISCVLGRNAAASLLI